MDWLTENKIPLGRWIKLGVDALNDNAAWFFDAIATVLGGAIEGLIAGLLWFHPLVLLALFAIVGGLAQRNWRLGLGIAASLLLVINMGYWRETIETLALVIFAASICMGVGVPLGIAAARRPWLESMLRPILDLMQTIPTFVYLIPTLILFGLGVVPGLISTIVFAIPAPIRLTTLGIKSTPRELIEAADAFGATRWQLLTKVQLPHAMPTITAGLTQCIMLSLSMVVIAALVGADGLGKPVVRALNTVNIARGFEAGLAIVILAILLDRVFRRSQRGGE
ncbi:MAG: choline ABC transporter permease subunit [Hyphomicrobiales bacterium]